MTKNIRRINTLIPIEIFEKLQKLSDLNRKNMTEVLKDSILLEEFVEGVYRAGGKLIIEREDGSTQELFKLLL